MDMQLWVAVHMQLWVCSEVAVVGVQALVRERMNDWGKGLCSRLGKKMVELTGDFTPDLRALLSADIIICTPEKWDGISRNWQNRTYVQKVGLLVIDEIHLLGADRYLQNGALQSLFSYVEDMATLLGIIQAKLE